MRAPDSAILKAAAAFVAVFVLSAVVTLRFLTTSSVARRHDAARGRVNERSDPDTEIIAVYIGSPTCAFSTSPSVRRYVGDITAALRNKTDALGWRFSTVGVAVAHSVDDGLEHLRRTGEFDEVSAGDNWSNEMAVRLLFGGHTGPPATPQVIVLRRVTHGPVEGRVVSEDRVLARKVGLIELETFADRQAPVPLRY